MEFALRFSDWLLVLVGVSGFFSGGTANAPVLERAFGEEASLAPIVVHHPHAEQVCLAFPSTFAHGPKRLHGVGVAELLTLEDFGQWFEVGGSTNFLQS